MNPIRHTAAATLELPGSEVSENTVSPMKFFVPGLDCWFIAELVRDDVHFTVVDAAEELSCSMDGARLHGENGTVGFFEFGRASCHLSKLRGGVQIRAAGESWVSHFVGHPARPLRAEALLAM